MKSLIVMLAAATAALSFGAAQARAPDQPMLAQSADVTAITPFSTDATGLLLKTQYDRWDHHDRWDHRQWRARPVVIGRGYGYERYRHDNGWHRGWDRRRDHERDRDRDHWRR